MKKKYYYSEKRHFIGLPVYILMFGIGVDQDEWGNEEYENSWFREIFGISYNLENIEKMISELGPKPFECDDGNYFVVKAGQMLDELYQEDWFEDEPIVGDCYIVARAPAIEMVEEYLGIFKDRDAAIQYAEYYMSFDGTDDVLVYEAVFDKAAPNGFEEEILCDFLDDDYYD